MGTKMQNKPQKLVEIEDNIIDTERNNVVHLIQTGGDGPSNYHPKDWLSPLPNGTIFLFSDLRSPSEPNLGQGKVLYRTEKAIYLGFVVNGQPVQGPVDPVRFCTKYSLYENLGAITEGEENAERDWDEGDDQGSTPALANDASLQGSDERLPPAGG